jgi:hypothetical protein
MINDSLKDLDETIMEIEKKISNEPDPFLESVLERLRIYKENSIPEMYEKAKTAQNKEREYKINGGFRGWGIS